MCGFVVFLSARGESLPEGRLERMAGLIAHRGPDDAGTFVENGVSIAFRRLAIFDLAPSGHQPMMSADGRFVIAFNGAIYNYLELRAGLETRGYTFRSRTDTEVLLAAYQEWGEDCLGRLNGMWAFVVYDRHERRIFASRDRFGIKPLYWYHDERGLILSSEIKAIRDSGHAQLAPNWNMMASFLLERRLDVNDDTFYVGVHRTPAASCTETDGSAPPQWRRFWDVDEAAAALDLPTRPVDQFRDLFDDAVRLRMRSDVPVGVLLSGGLDSTSIISSMAFQGAGQRVDQGQSALGAFSYRDPDFDENALIDETLRQTGAQLWPLQSTPEHLWDELGRHLWHQDEPVHSFTSVVTYELMKLARSQGVKVILNGQGADEVLAGYPSYFLDHWSELVRSASPLRAHKEIMAFARSHDQSALALHASVVRACLGHLKACVPGYGYLSHRKRQKQMESDSWVSQDVKKHWQPAERPHFKTLSESLRWSLERSHLPLYLRTEDRNSMAHAVEVRLPFLDHRLVEFAFRLGSQWKLSEEYTKVVLRMAMRGRIPEAVRTRVQKFGFPTATDRWFRSTLYTRFKDLLGSRAVRESGLWNVPAIEQDLEQHRQGKTKIGGRLFDVAQLASWTVLRPLSALLLLLFKDGGELMRLSAQLGTL